MSYGQIVDKNISDAFIKRIADDIIQGIDKVIEKESISKRRWIWELVQNAKDIPNEFKRVRIKVVLNPDEIIFSHNGDPFSLTNLINLIMQVSSKFEDEEDDVTGKFGTGFLVTHLLSKKIKVTGILLEKEHVAKKFIIEIDREAAKTKDLIPKIKSLIEKIKSIDEVNTSSMFTDIPDYEILREETDFDTSFCFSLASEPARNSASTGIKDLINTLPLTLLFVDKIYEFIIIDNTHKNQVSYKIESNQPNAFKYHEINIETSDNGLSDPKPLYFITKSDANDKTIVACQVENFESFNPVEWNFSTPKLYRDFPLIGSELFSLPFVVQSKLFFPNDERSGLLLVGEECARRKTNKAVLVNSLALQQEIISFLSDKNISNGFVLSNCSIPLNVPKEWYVESILSPLRLFLLDQKIVRSHIGSIELLSKIKFPKHDDFSLPDMDLDFFDVVLPLLGPSCVPFKDDLSKWVSCLDKDYDVWVFDLFYTLDNLIAFFKNKTIISLKENIREDVIVFLNRFYDFIKKYKLNSILDTNLLVPNQNGNFLQLSNLFVDDKIEPELISVLTSLGDPIKDRLIYKGISPYQEGHKSLNNKDISDLINTRLKDEKFLETKDSVDILFSLLRIFPNDTPSFRKDLFNKASDFFKVDYKTILKPSIQEFVNFDNAIKCLLTKLLNGIEAAGDITQLSVALNKNYESTVTWLDNFLSSLDKSKEYRDFLNEADIIPNQFGTFGSYDVISNDGSDNTPLPTALIDILKGFDETRDLKETLLMDGIGIKMPKTISLSHIAPEIEFQAKTVYKSLQFKEGTVTQIQINSLMDLINWVSDNEDIAGMYFKWSYDKRAEIFLINIEAGESRKQIIQILKRKDILNDLAKIALTLDMATLKYLSEIAEEIGASAIIALAEKERDKQADFSFKKRIGDSVEAAFKESFKKNNLPYVIVDFEGPCDFIIRNPVNSKEFFVEMKSIRKDFHYVNMAQSQGEFSTKNIPNFCLCVLERPVDWKVNSDDPISTDYFINELKAVPQIGLKLKDIVTTASQFKDECMNNIKEICVEFDNAEFKYRISRTIWEMAMPFDKFITYIQGWLD